MKQSKKHELNHVDLCFVIDTTGSMQTFINAAQTQLLNTIKLLSDNNKIDLKLGLVEYRDHPPQDTTFVTRIYPLTSDLKKMQNSINQLNADGGGDFPEAVYDGVKDACLKMQWREHSCRFALLVGDAPPHGFPDGIYPGGLTYKDVTATAEKNRVVVHGLCMGGDRTTKDSFTTIAMQTGGKCVLSKNADQVVNEMINMLDNEFKDLIFDGEVLSLVSQLEN
ncbi:MAG TPA: VWA domain-containing protein, partial [Allocoleopsis sp.]